jgi:serine/threonine protein kinase
MTEPPAETPTIGDRIADRYELTGLIAEAPAYTAFRARDQEVEVNVALWWMKPAMFPEDRNREGFVGAVVDLRGVIHPHLRRLFEAGRSGGGLYLTSQLGSGEGLLLRLGTARRPPEFEILRYATALAEALEGAHRLGHYHGLLVPSDVVQVAGQLKLGGVGLYRDASLDGIRESFAEARRYLAPEVVERGEATPASDVYSVAAVLAEFASGVSVPDLGEAIEVLASDQIKLADVLAQALSVSPDLRPQSPRALLDRMRLVLVDDRVPTAEQAIAEPPPDYDDADELPTVRDHSPVREEEATDHYRGPWGESQTRRPRDEVSTEVDSPAAPRRPRDTDRLFAEQGASKQEASIPPSSETVVEDRSGESRSSETVPEELPPPPAPPASTPIPEHVDSSQPPTLESGRRPTFVSMKPKDDDPRRPTPRLAAIDRPEMQPVLRPLGSMRKSIPPGALGNYAPPRDAVDRAERERQARLAHRLWLLVGVVFVLVAGAVLATWFFVSR